MPWGAAAVGPPIRARRVRGLHGSGGAGRDQNRLPCPTRIPGDAAPHHPPLCAGGARPWPGHQGCPRPDRRPQASPPRVKAISPSSLLDCRLRSLLGWAVELRKAAGAPPWPPAPRQSESALGGRASESPAPADRRTALAGKSKPYGGGPGCRLRTRRRPDASRWKSQNLEHQNSQWPGLTLTRMSFVTRHINHAPSQCRMCGSIYSAGDVCWYICIHQFDRNDVQSTINRSSSSSAKELRNVSNGSFPCTSKERTLCISPRLQHQSIARQ